MDSTPKTCSRCDELRPLKPFLNDAGDISDLCRPCRIEVRLYLTKARRLQTAKARAHARVLTAQARLQGAERELEEILEAIRAHDNDE